MTKLEKTQRRYDSYIEVKEARKDYSFNSSFFSKKVKAMNDVQV